MGHYTIETYELKREIFQFAKKISAGTNHGWQKFTADMAYGILASGSCVLSKIADTLKEDIQKKNTIWRLSRKLTENIPSRINSNYLKMVQHVAGKGMPVFVDDSDVIKPYGQAFESLGIVRDGSSPDKRLEKGYYVTEITTLTEQARQPVSLYSQIHSSQEKDYVSANDITFKALEQVFPLFPASTYVFDRGYDMNSLFSFLYQNKKDFIIRVTGKRKLFHKGKWYNATTLRDSHKGKLKTKVTIDGVETECWMTCVNVQITESRRPLKLILVYGLSVTPMMLVTNRLILSKDDVIRVARHYFMRWRIEEYFQFKKRHLGFENFRVRSLGAINALNRLMSYAICFLSFMGEKKRGSALRQALMREANALKKEDKVSFLLYRVGLGVCRVLARANAGIRNWFRIGRPCFQQMVFPVHC